MLLSHAGYKSSCADFRRLQPQYHTFHEGIACYFRKGVIISSMASAITFTILGYFVILSCFTLRSSAIETWCGKAYQQGYVPPAALIKMAVLYMMQADG